MKEKLKKTMIRYVLCIGGILLTTLSTAIFYLVSLGSDPSQVLMSGIANTLQAPYGTVITLFNLSMACLMLLFARHHVKAALFLTVLCAGVFVDGYLSVLSRWISADMSFPLRVVLGAFGCMVMCLGIYLYLLPRLGAAPVEGIGLFISEKTHIPYGRVRLILDVIFTALGWFLGGNFGVITALAVAITGPGVSLLERIFHRKVVER